MEIRTELIRMFEYDLWANLKWFPHCADEPYKSVMRHVVQAQLIWLDRSGGNAMVTASDPFDLVEEIGLRWVAHISNVDLEQTVEYLDLKGNRRRTVRRDICRHVINHGTYHRGQIRGMVEAAGILDFPETDYIGFLRELGI
jgi:uncharacterized damage-inducible protein DinB